ncbi:hypothetical protein D3C84_1278270 [compost metagenome]
MQGVAAIPASEIAVLESANKQDIETNCDRFVDAATAIITEDLAMNTRRQDQLRF